MHVLKPCISFLLEIPITLWFFRQFHFSGKNKLRCLLGCSFLLLLLPLYLVRREIPYGFFLRTPYRGLIYYAVLSLTKELERGTRLHIALCSLFLMVNAQMFFGIARVMGTETWLAPLMLSNPVQAIILSVIESAVILAIYKFFLILVPIERFRGISHMQLATYVMCILCGIFIRTALVDMYAAGHRPEDGLDLFGSLLTVSLFVCVSIVECYYYSELDALHMRQSIQASEYEVQALRQREQNEKNVHKIYHDMKNHFIALDSLLRENRLDEMHAYLSSLQEQLRWERPAVQTGTPILDQLLSEKMRQAASKEIPMTVELRFAACSFVSNVDAVILFGNALDNAIEAAAQVPTGQRFLSVKGSDSAGRFFCVISNSYHTPLHFINGLPVTSKQDSLSHGYGLSNIRTVLAKYDGEMQLSHTENHVFSLYLTIPLQR